MADVNLSSVETEAASAEEAPSEPKRKVSTIAFPYDDLDSALGVVQAVHRRGGRCATDELAAELHYSGVDNGAFRVRVSSARTFGLISVARESIALTNLGQRAVDPSQEARAREEAFRTVPLYRAVYERFRGTVLPVDIGIERVCSELGVSDKQTDKARQVLKRSAEQAGYFNAGRDRLVAPSFGPAPIDGQHEPEIPNGGGGNGAGGAGGGGGGGGNAPAILDHALIRGLVEALPAAGSVWQESDRKEWVALAESIFKVVYKTQVPALPAPNGLTSVDGATV